MTDHLFGYPVKQVPADHFVRQAEQAHISMCALRDLHHPRNPDALTQFKALAENVEADDLVWLHERFHDEHMITPYAVKSVNRDQIIIATTCGGSAWSRRTGLSVGPCGQGQCGTERWITIQAGKVKYAELTLMDRMDPARQREFNNQWLAKPWTKEEE